MDYGHAKTDEQLRVLEKRIRSEYKQAASDVKKKLDRQLKALDKEDRIKAKQLADGEITKDEYLAWRTSQMMVSGRWQSMRQMLVKTFDEADKTARSLIRDTTYDAYALNFNFGTFEAEKGANVSTAFTLYDRDTVKRLLRDDPKIIPAPGKTTEERIRKGELKRWNEKKVQSVMMQGLLQGESIPEISTRLAVEVGEMNMHSAIRAARTMTTASENAGRLDSYMRAKELGIDIKKRWLATLDGRTRHSHRQVDMEVKELEDVFSNGLMYPSDPDGAPAEVYNCRCTLEASIPEYDTGDAPRRQGQGFTDYETWKNEHEKQKKADAKASIINGKDISGTWTRREDKFDFEIEDVINAQGFDGLPRIVDEDEFNRLVKEANGGDGFIAQRTYSAQSEAVLNNYRDELYHGHWYVDCSTGGAQYGQGMYCAADYSGKLSSGIKEEMKHYISLGKTRLGGRSIIDLPSDEQDALIKSKIAKKLGVKVSSKDDLFVVIKSEVIPNSKYSWAEKMEAYSKVGGKYDLTGIIVDLREYKTQAKSYVETLTLDKSAKIISFSNLRQKRSVFAEEYRNKAVEKVTSKMSDIEKIAFRYTNGIESEGDRKIIEDLRWDDRDKYRDLMENRDKWQKEYSEISQKSYEYSTTMDDGVFATLLGYDAINAENHGESGSYTVILNRTKVIIRRP